MFGNGIDTEQRARFLPRDFVVWFVALVNRAANRFQVVGGGAEFGRDGFKERIESRGGGESGRDRNTADGGAPARTARGGIIVFADMDFNGFERQAECFGHDNIDHGAGATTQIL